MRLPWLPGPVDLYEDSERWLQDIKRFVRVGILQIYAQLKAAVKPRGHVVDVGLELYVIGTGVAARGSGLGSSRITPKFN
jgi:hypothetical protein